MTTATSFFLSIRLSFFYVICQSYVLKFYTRFVGKVSFCTLLFPFLTFSPRYHQLLHTRTRQDSSFAQWTFTPSRRSLPSPNTLISFSLVTFDKYTSTIYIEYSFEIWYERRSERLSQAEIVAPGNFAETPRTSYAPIFRRLKWKPVSKTLERHALPRSEKGLASPSDPLAATPLNVFSFLFPFFPSTTLSRSSTFPAGRDCCHRPVADPPDPVF